MIVDAKLNTVNPPFVINGLQYPSNIEDVMSDAELKALGLWRVVDDVVTDPNLTPTGSSLVIESDGLVHRVYTTVSTVPPPTVLVDAERDRRCYGGFIYNGKAFQTDAASISNILGAAQLAFMAVVAGAKQGDFSWAGAGTTFSWIASDNSQVQMDAFTVVLFAKAAAAFRSQIIFAARTLKNAVAAGASPDIYADTSWGVDRTSPTSTYLTDPSGSPAPAATS